MSRFSVSCVFLKGERLTLPGVVRFMVVICGFFLIGWAWRCV